MKRLKNWTRGHIFSLVVMASLAGGQRSFGQSTSTLKLPQSQKKLQQTPEGPSEITRWLTGSTLYGQIRFESMRYFADIPENPKLTNSQFLSARLSGVANSSWATFAGDLSAGTFFSFGQSHYAVHELYGGSNRQQNWQASVGRRKYDWSELDRRWQLGLWQPQFAIDTLRPESQGLTGGFFEWHGEQVHLLGFATPIFVPSMGPEIREENGGLVADSRWYRAPSREYNFNSNINSIVYDLDVPEVAKLVANPGYGANVKVGDLKQGPWVLASHGYKPVNSLLLKRRIVKAIADDRIDVKVSPDVTYHKITSLDFGYSWENLKGTLSYLEDQPEFKKPQNQDWAIQQLKSSMAYSAAVDVDLTEMTARNLSAQVSYLKVEGGEIQDVVESGKPDDMTLFTQRFNFYDAFMVRVEGELSRLYKRPLVSRVKWLYDSEQKGSLMNTEFLYYPTQHWAFLVGADVLGVEDENAKNSGFLNQYRANDRVYGGMTYVF